MRQQKLFSLVLLALSLTFVLTGCKAKFWERNEGKKMTEVTTKQTPQKLIGGDKDKYGCLIAAGYAYCAEKQKCLRTWEEPCPSLGEPINEQDEEKIKTQLGGKCHLTSAQVALRIDQQTAQACKGHFYCGEEDNLGQGFLAKRNGPQWEVFSLGEDVDYGLMCQVMQKNAFPAEMLKTCSGMTVLTGSGEEISTKSGSDTVKTEMCKNQCGDGECAEIVCQAQGCPCAESKETCPQDCK